MSERGLVSEVSASMQSAHQQMSSGRAYRESAHPARCSELSEVFIIFRLFCFSTLG